jgi:GxxExxY protein
MEPRRTRRGAEDSVTAQGGNRRASRQRLNEITGEIVDSAMRVHSALGPGLLESAYLACLAFELRDRGLKVQTQMPFPVVYRAVRLDVGYRLDALVEDEVILDAKAVTTMIPLFEAQLLSYLILNDIRVGLLINFHVIHLKDGITRMVNNF